MPRLPAHHHTMISTRARIIVVIIASALIVGLMVSQQYAGELADAFGVSTE